MEKELNLGVLRHSTSHVMAQAIKRIWPNAKLAIGPAIDNGFYYDFDLDYKLSPEDLEKIETEMRKVIKENFAIERFELPRNEAIKLMQDRNEPYKIELIENLPDDVAISFYKQGEFVDLCAGPHLNRTGEVKAFKLQSINGAYWHGDEKNKMLQRIYGTAFFSKEELNAYLEKIEEAKKRDHRKIGQEMGLFMFSNEGQGFPFFLNKGMIIKNTLIDYWREIHKEAGYQEVSTPQILNRHLWETSGHWDHYRENMYTTSIDKIDHAIKPMNCPGGMLVYKNDLHSYKELPLRVGELGIVHRHENSGNLHGLMRVRCFTQDDAHIFMEESQIESEVAGVMQLIDKTYNLFGFKYFIELSTRPENSMGTDEQWEKATNALKNCLDHCGREYKVNEGDGAFYGPKIDFHLEDCLGRTWQCGTIQLDFQLPERFDISYIGPDGEKHRPVMVHRVVLGSVERFIGILTEHFAGKFPVWIAPEQVRVMPIADKHHEYANKVCSVLKEHGIRYSIDDSCEKFGAKMRAFITSKTPYGVIIGDKEIENNQITVRSRKTGEQKTFDINEFANLVGKEIKERVLELGF